jgi:hypothetical protein
MSVSGKPHAPREAATCRSSPPPSVRETPAKNEGGRFLHSAFRFLRFAPPLFTADKFAPTPPLQGGVGVSFGLPKKRIAYLTSDLFIL